uniref:Cytochrome P450 n=1 Tax=Cannabis sativa TaxID=3483 RepID=A0A803NJ24_CANSA
MEVSMLMIMGVISTVLVSILFVFQILFWATPKDMEGIPGRLGWPVIGESFSFISEFSSPSGIFTFMNKRQQKYGKVFKSFVLGRFTVFMTGREASKILLSGKDGMVSLNLFYTGQQVLGPTSLLQTTGDAHKRLRRLIAEPLSIDGLKKYFNFINSLTISTLDNWHGRTVLVLEEASTFTLQVIGHMIMSLEPSGEEQEKFRANFKLISSSFASLPFKIPGTAFHRGIKEEHLEIKAKRESGTSLTWAEVNNMPYTAKSPLRPYSFLGFGNGPRMCPGINLAKIEISIFIHHLVCTYKWRGLDEDDSVQPTLVRMPRNKYPIIVEAL